MSASYDYVALAIITIFTSFFSGLGKELIESLVRYIRDRKGSGHTDKKEER